MMSIRYFQRVAWEAAALQVISEEYGYGSKLAGVIIPVAIVGLMALPFVSNKLHRNLGSEGYMASMDALELLGILLMFRIGEPTRASLVQFLFASCLYYTGNWAQSVPYTSMRPDFELPGHPWLALENNTGILWLSMYVFYFTGP